MKHTRNSLQNPVTLDDIYVFNYNFKSEQRRLIHLAFKAIQNGIPLYIPREDYENNKGILHSVTGSYRTKNPSQLPDGMPYKNHRREYRHRLRKHNVD